MKNITLYLFCLLAMACSRKNKNDSTLSENLDKYTGTYEGYFAEYVGDSLLFSDSSFQERIWLDDTGLFWSSILGEVDSVADDIKYSSRMRFNNELSTQDTLEDELFIFLINSTLKGDSLIRNMDVHSKSPSEHAARMYLFALRKK